MRINKFSILRVFIFILFGILLPGTIYGNSENVQHPVYRPTGSIKSHEKIIHPILSVSESEMLKIIPEMNGLRFCGCPNCKGGSQENQMEWNGISDPTHLHCRYCKMVFPNDKYPENMKIKAINRQGEQEIWQYFEDNNKKKYFFSARARYAAKKYMAEGAYHFAAAYVLIGKQEFARRAALILNRYAEVYPKWNVMNDRVSPNAKGPISNAKEPYPYWGGIWNRWFYDDIPIKLVLAYDLIYDSGELEKRSREQRIDTKNQIEGMFHSAVKFVRTYKENYSNMSPYIYRGLIITGRILGEPDYVHDAINRIERFYKTGFFFDGFWHEGTISYHNQVINFMGLCAHAIKDYSDPPGYRWLQNGKRLDNVDIEKNIPIIKNSKFAPLLLTYPDGHVVPLHDTWPTEQNKTDFIKGPMLLTDYGHVRLSSNIDSDNIVQAHLHFSGGYGHQHADGLQFILFGKGHELLSDIGYTHTAWNFWTRGTLSHNTVVVNGQTQKSTGHGGNLQLYSPMQGPVQATEASQLTAYSGIVDEFRRRLILIKVNENDSYVVDLFHVRGGTKHEYFLHGSSWFPQTANINLSLNKVPGTLLGQDVKYKLPQNEWGKGTVSNNKLLDYAMFSNLREVSTDQPFSITWKFIKNSPAALRTTFMGQPDCKVILADTPQIRPAKEDDNKLADFKRPSLVIQRNGKDPLDSTFVAIHEPYIAETFLKNIKILIPSDKVKFENYTALSVTHDQGTDYIISSKQPGGVWFDLSLEQGLKGKARIIMVRRNKGRIAFVYLYDGEELIVDDHSIKCEPSPKGRIIAVNRNENKNEYSLLVDMKLPPNISMKGYSIIVTHPDQTTHGYIIKQLEAHENGTMVYLENDPGFDLNNSMTRFLFYPKHELYGTNNCRINNSLLIMYQEDGSYRKKGNCPSKITMAK
ncbi:MAG: heparinase II/III family protein [Deltaproteobacteria bacterium]|nr:heparinase II/III family protein [Deltaproteobacteria bacterium]